MTNPHELTVLVLPTPSVCRVECKGELDLSTTPMLRETLMPIVEAGTPVTLDLRGVEFIDSAGLGVMLEAAKWLKINVRPQLVVEALTEGQPWRVLKTSKFDAVYDIRLQRREDYEAGKSVEDVPCT